MIYYYMMLEDLTVAELASRAGISKGKVKKHISNEYFNKVTVAELKKYAQVFDRRSKEFSLVPWQKEFEKMIGRQVELVNEMGRTMVRGVTKNLGR